jgi:hypothetical protein
MAQVFISYSRRDRDMAGWIAQALEAEGVSIWWDHDISSGERWDKVIKRELDAAACVLALWSPNSVDADATVASEWVANEATEAKRRGVLVPVLVMGGQPPFEFQRVQALDLNQWRGQRDEPVWRALMERVRILVGHAPPPVTPPAFQPPVHQQPVHQQPVHQSPPPQPPVHAAAGAATLSLRREARFSYSVRKMAVFIDGQKAAEIGNDATLNIPLPAGEHTLQIRLDWSKSEEQRFRVGGGQIVRFVTGAPKATDLSAQFSARIELTPD